MNISKTSTADQLVGIENQGLTQAQVAFVPFDDDPTVTLRGGGIPEETTEQCVVVVDLPGQECAKRQIRRLIAELVHESRGEAFTVQPGATSSATELAEPDSADPLPDHDAVAGLALSQRELDVLDRLSRGEPAKRVAHQLGISVHTCRGYIRSLHQKLGARNQVEVVIRAKALGLCPEIWPRT